MTSGCFAAISSASSDSLVFDQVERLDPHGLGQMRYSAGHRPEADKPHHQVAFSNQVLGQMAPTNPETVTSARMGDILT